MIQGTRLHPDIMVTGSKVEILLTPGIKKWSEKFRKGGGKVVSRDLADHSRKSLAGIITCMGQYGLRDIANEFFHCEYCREWDTGSKIKMKIDRSGNLTCRYHGNTVFLSNQKISEIAFGVEKAPENVSVSVNEPRKMIGGKRIARKCYGIHPHCSICGECHTNVLTHDRGHPRR